MAKTTTITFEIPEQFAKRLEQVTRVSVTELAKRMLLEYFDDDRRTKVPTKEISIRFPIDWFERMLTVWGEGQIGVKIRALLYPRINTDKTRPLAPPPEWKEKTPVKTTRKPNAVDPSGLSCIKHVMVPLDWYERLQETHGDALSTYVKAVVYRSLLETPSRKKLSIPRRLESMLTEL
jgi:hypothetical protein